MIYFFCSFSGKNFKKFPSCSEQHIPIYYTIMCIYIIVYSSV